MEGSTGAIAVAETHMQFDDEMAEILESFLVETNELLELLGQDLLLLERTPHDSELHNTIFRAVHTIKGTSSFLGFEQLTTLAHRFEDVLNKIRKGELAVTSSMMDVMFGAYDLHKELVRRIEARNAETVDIETMLVNLAAISKGESENPPAPAAVPESPAKPITGTELGSEFRKAENEKTEEKEPAAQPSSPFPVTSKATSESTIRVDVARLDSLMNLVGELVLGRNRLSQIVGKASEQYGELPLARELFDTSSQMDLITTELQMAVMKTRMVPIGKVFNKLPRLMRDLAKETGKEINFEMSGQETEMDKSIIEELNDPLVHILRNCADHAIEMPDERRKAGKPVQGSVCLKAAHEGNNIVITVRDDGKGMDPEFLKSKALEKGIVTEARAAEMSKHQAFELIFAPGFSTATTVTNVSGRGVGMDVVRTNIARLKGIIQVDSESGRGTTIIIKLPLTLAIIQGLLCEVGDEVYCVPLGSVIEVVNLKPDDIKTINGREVIRLRDEILPLAHLRDVFHVVAKEVAPSMMYVVVVGVAERRVGIVVDSLFGQREVVIKSMGDYLGNVLGIAGSTILGDGRVVMIIDVGKFIEIWQAMVSA
jgi:two-component system chemotaxis sensor kinase CheA